MKYKDYSKRCKEAQSWARLNEAKPDLDPVKRSEYFILSGNQEAARATIDSMPGEEPAYLQAVKASRHFDEPAFMADRELPAASTRDWTLPVLRAACSAACKAGDGERLERYIAASPGIAGIDAVRALAIVSNAFRNTGDLPASRRALLEAFELASRVARPAVADGPKGIDLPFAKRRQTAFHDLVRIIDFGRHSLFPCSGTLLGFYRDKDFIPSDGDVDLGCIDPAGFEAVKAALRKSGRFYLSPGRMGTNFNAKHVDGAKIDVSLYVPRDGAWAKTSHVYEWRFDRFALGELATDYGRLPVPEAPEAYLSSMYEDWWVPRAGYDSRIDSPNLSYVSPDEVVIVMASHLLATYLQEPGACHKWMQKFERLPGDMRAGLEPFVSSVG